MPPKTLKEIHDECLAIAKASSPTIVKNGRLYKWKGSITSFVIGELQFRCMPYFGLSVSDASTHIPCIPVDPVKNANKLLKLCNHTILLSDPEFVVEVFTVESNEYYLVHVLLNGEKLRVLEKNIRTVTMNLKSIKNCSSSHENVSEAPTEWCHKVLVLKISSAILTPKKDVFCFAFVVSVNSECDADNDRFWLILKNGEVSWKDLLVQNRMYNIHVPSDVPRDYFRHRSSLYSVFDTTWDLSFQQMLHHRDLMNTNAAVYLPRNSKLSTVSESAVTTCNAEKWFNISDPDLTSLKFASVFGIIKDIRYVEAWKSFSCSWCDKNDNVFEKTIQESDCCETKGEENNFETEWRSPTSPTIGKITENDKICFPELQFKVTGEEKINGFGIRGGKLTVQITLQKCYSDKVAYIFLKRWKQSQYPAGLIPGVTVCFTDVNVKRSKKKCYYFVSTPLTRILHLETTGIKTTIVPQVWGSFGFPFARNKTDKIWGILDLDLLTKVSILAKCKLCDQKFLQYCCSNVFCFNSRQQMSPEYNVVAIARLFVRGFKGCEASSLFLKNENVQKYLGFPDRIWQKLCYLSANSELLYLHQYNEDQNCDITNVYFQMYCKVFRPKVRFHVCCRSFKNNENCFFCIELSEISPSRLSATREMLESKAKKNEINQSGEI